MGAALHESTPEGLKPLGFFSRKLTPTQANYSTYDRELLSIYSAVVHFRYMLEARPFTIYTDHKPLTFAFNQKNDSKASPRRLRQLDFISQFTTDIQFVMGHDNVVADALSRIDEISIPSTIDIESLADAQLSDPDFAKLLDDADKLSLQIKKFPLPNSTRSLFCDISTNTIRPVVPNSFCKKVFDAYHNISHPGIKASSKLIANKYVWPNMKTDIKLYCQSCLQCQKTKIHRHTKTPFGDFGLPEGRFKHIHIDIIGPFPVSQGFTHCLTIVDRFTRWPEVSPIAGTTAETVAQALYFTWISRFGVPQYITSDQGKQFESSLFRSFSTLFGIHLQRTSAYNPKCNGLVERLHRPLKQALACLPHLHWVDALPAVLLGLRSVHRPELKASVAELVYGETLRLPGDFITDVSLPLLSPTFLTQLQKTIRSLRPTPTSHHGSSQIFIPKDLSTCTHIFLRCDAIRRSLQPQYDGPFPVVKRLHKNFVICVHGKNKTVSIDRLKPAYLLDTNFSPAPLSPSSQPTDPVVPITTRYGRKVRFPDKFVP